MADISKITLPSGTTYNIKDATARSQISALSGAMKYIGTTTTALTDGSTTNPITISGSSVTATAGNVAIYGEKEFVFNGTKWQEFGSTGSLKALAFKDNATGNVSVTGTPSGTVSQPTFTGTQATVSVKGTPAGSVTISSSSSGTKNYTPAGTVSQPTFSGTQGSVSVSGTATGSVSVSTSNSGTTNYTPSGTVTIPDGMFSVGTSGGMETVALGDGVLPACTLPTWTASVANENLTIGWSAGSYTTGSLPSTAQINNISALGVVIDPDKSLSFSGTPVRIAASFSGTSFNSTGNFTPAGTVSQPTFTGTGARLTGSFSGNELTSTGNFTPAGSVSQPTFTGNSLTSTGSVTVS